MSHHRQVAMKQSRKQQSFVGVRSRILAWYFLLTASITFVSVYATYKIFCDSTQKELGGQLQRDIQAFEQSSVQPSNPEALTQAIQTFSSRQVSTPNRYLLVFSKGQILHTPQSAQFVQNNQAVLDRWKQLPENAPQQLDGYLVSVMRPLNGQPGRIIAVHDATMQYHMAELTLRLVVQVTLVGLILFSAIAWLTAGKILSPLRQVTETARNISETDLTQRLSVQGKDEIAELTLTFNQMLDRLQAAFTSQQDFIKDVSHELRTPITIIQGHLELLGDDPEERRETIALVRDELKRMNRFVSDLLLLMRIERPNFLRADHYDVATLTEEIFAKAEALADRSWKLESVGTGEVFCDRQRITQAVLNLAQNASQYTQKGDVIAIGSAIVEETVRFWVRDTGEGIDLDDQARIFDRFARGSNSERRSEGSGLGLSIVQAIIKAHQGHIDLCSRLGEGSTFTITLPLRGTH